MLDKPLIIPDPETITRWAYRKSKDIPRPEWDEQITILKNADLLLTLVTDRNCPRRSSVLKCLYALVGTSISRHSGMDLEIINALLEKAKESQDQIILNLVKRSRVILGDLRKYDYIEWCQGGFSEKDLPAVS